MSAEPALASLLADALDNAAPDSSLAVIFPGQGSQKVGMGSDLAAVSPAARQVFQAADRVLGLDLSSLCFNGPDDALTATVNSQPAIFVTSLACLAAALEARMLDRRPAFLAGHSLGEYTALVAAGALGFADGLLLVRERGHVMQAAGRERPGAMAAIVALDEDTVRAVCQDSGAEVCNYNAPTQIVVGGAPAAVRKACALAKERGGRGLPLNVSGAFHTSLMKPAADQFATALERVPIADPAIPVVSNVTASVLATAADVREDLRLQMTMPVRWHQSVTAMIEAGASRFIEVGPGKALTAQLKRATPQVSATAIDGASTISSPSNV